MSKTTAGTYTQVGNTITVTATGTWSVSELVYITFSTGTSNYVQTRIITGGINSFTITVVDSQSTSGICSVVSYDIEPTAEMQKLSTSSVIDLFELDYSSLPGGTVIYFHSGINGLGNNIVWQGKTYSRYPIEVEGFERSSSGTLPRPKIKVANVLGAISALVYNFQDLVGTKLTRRRTFVKYLDAINFQGSVNPTADPNVGFADEIWTIDRKSSENPIFVEFELSTAFDVAGVLLPRRHCIQNTCTWKYKSAECGYYGIGGVATKNDISIPGVSGTYSKTGTNITVTAAGTWTIGNSFTIDFTSGTAFSGLYTIGTGGTGSFIISSAESSSTSGTCIVRSGATTTDVCGKRLSSCRLRFGTNNALPFGAFPGVGLMRSA